MILRSVKWSYLNEGPADFCDEDQAVRREWWYDPMNTYVYQLREPDGSWGQVYGEYEEDGFPVWVANALKKAGVAC